MDGFTSEGLTFEVRDAGPADGEVVVLLHGFPQNGSSWAAVAAGLATAGYRTLVPDQRGYTAGASPRGRPRYRIPHLVGDIVALVRAAGGTPVHVVGHDWGAIVAWMLAAHRPDLVRTVTGVSVPHLGAYLRALRTADQARRSWYVLALQLPRIPERVLGAPWILRRLLRRSGQSPDAARRDATLIQQHGSGPIDWYRALPLTPPRMLLRHVRVPAMQVWGARDPFVSRVAIDGNPAFVDGPYRLEVLPDVGHWVPDRAPERLAELILEHIRSASN